MISAAIETFLKTHRLPQSYAADAERWFSPLLDRIELEHSRRNRTVFVGINGCQGSGKSTLANYLACRLRSEQGMNAIDLSLDDFYFSRNQRRELANQVHPLLATRGVPGTHDLQLAEEIFNALSEANQSNSTVAIPRFDKSLDDPFPLDQWPIVETPVDVVIVEGWCWGSLAQPESALDRPVNQLEAEKDPDAVWRRYVNRQLREFYPPLFDRMHFWVMLKAPGFDQVFRWRLEQEQKLAGKRSGHSGDSVPSQIMSEREIEEFIQYFQRVTEHTLQTLPDRVDYLYELDENRKITQLQMLELPPAKKDRSA